MITVMGATGNTGKVVAARLLAAGRKVRAIGRSTKRLRELAQLGAQPAGGDARDANFLTTAFGGAEAVYAMVPPDIAQPTSGFITTCWAPRSKPRSGARVSSGWFS
ncbi:MAG: NmrA family NAD(P)-binding protein [Thermoanaerobaculia bacterium]|nr:NmrA family NAD(P)-binding protein [Thermoanaerobaculia bacterium]